MNEKGRTTPSYFVPAEPFLRLVREAIARVPLSEEEDWDQSIILTPEAQVGLQIWGTPDGSYSELAAKKRVAKMLASSYGYLDFDVADQIVCGTRGCGLWHSDPEYAEIYQSVDLKALDVVRPTCVEGAAESAQELLSEHGSARAVGKNLRIAPRAVMAALAGAAS